MQVIGVSRSAPARVTVAGRSMRIVNHPGFDYSRQSNDAIGLPIAAHLLVGFDRTPSITSYDAIVSPFTAAVFPVPDGTKTVTVAIPADAPGYTLQGILSVATPLPVLIDWVECAVEPAASSLDVYAIKDVNFGTGGYRAFLDAWNGIWSPSRWTNVLDQQLGAPSTTVGAKGPMLRPIMAPSQVVTATGLLVANTLTPFTGVGGVATSPSGMKFLKRLIISASAAGLVVVGDNGLTVASVSSHEAARVNFAAAGVQSIDYGEGLDLGWFGSGAAVWKYYASTAITVDLTAILG